MISCHIFELINKIHFNQWIPVSLLGQLAEVSCSHMGSANQHISVLYVEYGTTDDILKFNQKRKLKCNGFHLRCCELPKHNTKAKDICFLIIWKMIYNLEKMHTKVIEYKREKSWNETWKKQADEWSVHQKESEILTDV